MCVCMCALLNLSIFGTFTEQLKTKQNQPTKITIDKKYIVRYIFFFVCSAKKLKKSSKIPFEQDNLFHPDYNQLLPSFADIQGFIQLQTEG